MRNLIMCLIIAIPGLALGEQIGQYKQNLSCFQSTKVFVKSRFSDEKTPISELREVSLKETFPNRLSGEWTNIENKSSFKFSVSSSSVPESTLQKILLTEVDSANGWHLTHEVDFDSAKIDRAGITYSTKRVFPRNENETVVVELSLSCK